MKTIMIFSYLIGFFYSELYYFYTNASDNKYINLIFEINATPHDPPQN